MLNHLEMMRMFCAAAEAASKLVKNSQLKVYKGGDHGLPATAKDRVNADLLAFLAGSSAT